MKKIMKIIMKKIMKIKKKDKSKIGTEQVSMLKKDQLQGEIYQYQNEINALKSKKNQELLEELYLYLEIDDENEYRKKMKGFNQKLKK